MPAHPVATLIAFALVLLAAAAIFHWTLALHMIYRATRGLPRLAEGLDYFGAAKRADGKGHQGNEKPDDQRTPESDSPHSVPSCLRASVPSVSIIIPAHDEAEFIGDALRHLRASDYPDFEIIVAADRCSDATASIVRDEHAAVDPRVRLVEISEIEEGWSGKCYASSRGARAARGEWLIFADADTIFDPTLIRAALGLALARGLDFLSLLGRLRQRHDFEKSAQPVAAMSLMKMYPLDRANREDPDTRRPFANGQFMLIRRETYDAIGGHEAPGMRAAILEDLRFARRITYQLRRRIGVTLAPDLFEVRMYETRDEFRRGWKRIFIEAANRNIARMKRAAWRLRILALATVAMIMSLAYAIWLYAAAIDRPLAIALFIVTSLALATQCGALAWIYRLQGATLTSLWRYPLGCFTVASIFTEAADDLKSGRGIEWARLRYAVAESAEQR